MLFLFDIDGTLIRTQGVGRTATRASMLEVFGTAAGIEAHVFGGKTDWFTLIELLADYGFDADEVGRRMPAFEKAMAQNLSLMLNANNVAACVGAIETVQALRRRSDLVLGIVTGNTVSSAPVKLRAGGFDPAWFPVGAFGSEAIHRDELPALALQRAVQFSRRQITPHEVVVIGDTLMDIQSARALGAQAVAVTTGFTSREDLAAATPDYLLDNLTALLEIFPGP